MALVGKGDVNGSIVLAADDPAALATFYGALLEVEPQPGLSASHWRLPWPPGGWLEIYAPSRSRPQARQPGRLALCLQRPAAGSDPMERVQRLEAWMQEAPSLGATLLEPPHQEPFGAEAWMLNPEGNCLLLLVHGVLAQAPGSGCRMEPMKKPPLATPRESTEEMVRNIGWELAEIQQAIRRCHGDGEAQGRISGTWMAHLLISSAALLHNLLIDTARRPRRIEAQKPPLRDEGTA